MATVPINPSAVTLSVVTLLISVYAASGQATSRPAAVTLSVPAIVTGQESVPVRVTLTNTTRDVIAVLPQQIIWYHNLGLGQGMFKLIPLEGNPAPISHDLNLHHLPDIALVDLAPGESVSLDFELRQLLDLSKAQGKYRLEFKLREFAGTTEIAFVPDKRPRKLLGRHEAAIGQMLYAQNPLDTSEPPQIELSQVLDGGRALILARTTYVLDCGEIQLAALPKPETPLHIVHAHARPTREMPKRPRRANELMPTPPDPPIYETEYVAAAWLDGSRLMYATFGSYAYNTMVRMGTPPKAFQIVPAFRRMAGESPIVLADNVRQLAQSRADADGRVHISVVNENGSNWIITVDECGAVIKKESPEKEKSPSNGKTGGK